MEQVLPDQFGSVWVPNCANNYDRFTHCVNCCSGADYFNPYSETDSYFPSLPYTLCQPTQGMVQVHPFNLFRDTGTQLSRDSCKELGGAR